MADAHPQGVLASESSGWFDPVTTAISAVDAEVSPHFGCRCTALGFFAAEPKIGIVLLH
ncbi:MAG: hypothetical protein QMD46_13020 [Methanomicrobiales archaeon]|nr:hypothetical protein [Methanomicrobiales archaeon]MDI6876871.1 hypothetical protein [Methanomicrobiales archaeon]